MVDLPFDISRPRDGMQKGPILPSGSHPIFGCGALRSVDDYLVALHMAMGDSIQKAELSLSYLGEAAKALGAVPPQAFSYSTMSFLPDPANYGLMQWPGLNPESLRKIARENVAPIIVVRQRANDIGRYSMLSTHLWKPGWRVVLRDPSADITEADKKAIKEAEKFIINCSMDGDVDPRDRDAHLINPFEMFLRSFIDDSLTFDGWAVWTDMDSSGRVNAFTNLPAGMIRLAVPTRGYKGDPDLFAALVDETGTPVKPFTRKELTWRIRNPRNDPAIGFYGWPEIEMAVSIIQAFTGAVELNKQTFTNSAIPNGMLLLKGDFWTQEQIDALSREWTNMKRGLSKLWGLPVMGVPEDSEVELIQFMDLKGQDVRYKDHMNMMMGLTCLIWGFPIRRLGMFVSGHTRDSQPTHEAAIELQHADDPGLPYLLLFVENTINPYLLRPRWPNLHFEFTGKNPKEDAREFESRKLARTWKESRAEADLPPLKDLVEGGDEKMKEICDILELMPEDPAKVGAFQAIVSTLKEQEQLEEMGMQPGAGGSSAQPGAPMRSKKDPAESQGHGNLAGVRRNSRMETERAAARRGENTH